MKTPQKAGVSHMSNNSRNTKRRDPMSILIVLAV